MAEDGVPDRAKLHDVFARLDDAGPPIRSRFPAWLKVITWALLLLALAVVPFLPWRS
jgi:hypothetical protein